MAVYSNDGLDGPVRCVEQSFLHLVVQLIDFAEFYNLFTQSRIHPFRVVVAIGVAAAMPISVLRMVLGRTIACPREAVFGILDFRYQHGARVM